MSRIAGIKSYDLTASYTEITIPQDLHFTQYTMTTDNGSAAKIRYDTEGDNYFPLSVDLGTSPMRIDKNRAYNDAKTRLFDAKGTVGAKLCIMFWVD